MSIYNYKSLRLTFSYKGCKSKLLHLSFSGLAKVAIFTANVDAVNQCLINHKCVCGALNRHFCQTRVSGSGFYFLTFNNPCEPKFVNKPIVICSKCSLYFCIRSPMPIKSTGVLNGLSPLVFSTNSIKASATF